jgi:hypothetical protein
LKSCPIYTIPLKHKHVICSYEKTIDQSCGNLIFQLSVHVCRSCGPGKSMGSIKIFHRILGGHGAQGESGTGSSSRTYQFVLGDKFIEIKNTTRYSPQEKNPKGETHEDIGFISFDKFRKIFVLRQLHVESFVTQYKAETSPDPKTFVFVSESIENIPPGWRARETYRITNDNEFIETFELAAPNNDFAAYSTTIYKRKIP